ncbi:MAG: antitoxin family protein [Euryarchaeota archaeon]|nr:antitoxin family protein [Euryarchaeota archaeon]
MEEIEVVYKDGVFKPVKKLNLKEKERMRIMIKPKKGLAKEFQGALKLDNEKLIEEIAESDEIV